MTKQEKMAVINGLTELIFKFWQLIPFLKL